ncbi:putative SP-containing protein [Vairimorpha necatrix]|uniref:SP-containing protein n=1 Tax=Vairimorpha necatrix TaxID=6039 RepID=A0AAX4JCH7_9MICR
MLHILFTFCELTLFTNHKKNDIVDVYIGSYDYDGSLDSFCIFLTEERGYLDEKNTCPFIIDSDEETIHDNRIPFEVVEEDEYQNIRFKSRRAKNKKLVWLFVHSKEYYKVSFKISPHRKYYLEFMFKTRGTGNYHFSTTPSINLKPKGKIIELRLNKIMPIDVTGMEIDFDRIMNLYKLN